MNQVLKKTFISPIVRWDHTHRILETPSQNGRRTVGCTSIDHDGSFTDFLCGTKIKTGGVYCGLVCMQGRGRSRWKYLMYTYLRGRPLFQLRQSNYSEPFIWFSCLCGGGDDVSPYFTYSLYIQSKISLFWAMIVEFFYF